MSARHRTARAEREYEHVGFGLQLGFVIAMTFAGVVVSGLLSIVGSELIVEILDAIARGWGR